MVAYVVWDDVVAGSNPVTPNPFTKVIDKHMYYASLVQLVERRSPKPDVVGSSPTGREKKNPLRKALFHNIHNGTLGVER